MSILSYNCTVMLTKDRLFLYHEAFSKDVQLIEVCKISKMEDLSKDRH